MMKNTIHPPYRKLKLLVILPLIAGVFYAFAAPEYRYANGNEDQKPTYSITQNKVEIPFTNQLNKNDLEAIKADLAKVGLTADYTSLEFTEEGKLKEMSAKVTSGTGSVSWNSKEITGNTYPVFKKEPTGEFGIYISGVIAGKVVKPGGSPLQGAAVVIAGTTVGTVTSADGQFQLKDVPKDAELVISYVGYENIKIKPEEGQPTIITMNPVIVDINEVTVTALASTQSKTLASPFGTTIKMQTNSPLQFGSKDGGKPLIVIDGVITDNTNVNNIPTETIESITVLKDESATKLYGDKGKNGVIEIIKKKGSLTSQNSNIDVNIQQTASAQKNKDVYTIVEQMPEFPGGEAALRKFLAYNIKYPHSAVEKGIQGKEIVSFVVTSKGSVTDAKILRGVYPSLDQEALRVVNSMPAWIPGKQGGKEVDVQYTLPINFVLEPAQPAAKEEKGNEPYTVVEQMPEYPGGVEALKAYLASNIKYPTEAHQKGIQGKVFVSFEITKTGSVSNPKVVRGVDPLLDQEAVRVVQSMPTWIPGKQNGENVVVSYTIPINFVLEGKTEVKVEQGKEPYTMVEQMPEYPGGVEALKAYLMTNIKYPTEAHQKGIQGKVFVSFVVTKTGSISNAKVVRGVDALLDQEAIRVVASMPTWIPGKQNGETVDVVYTIPINFVLEQKAQQQAAPSAQNGLLIIVPNPTKSRATVTLKGSDSNNKLQVSIIDSNGQMLKRETKNGPSFTLSVSSLTPGTYRVVVVDGNKLYQGSLVINR